MIRRLTPTQLWYRDTYLTSDHWRHFRQLALIRAHFRCRECGSSRRLNVHHRTYERLWQEWPSDVRVLCRTCHVRQHRKGFPMRWIIGLLLAALAGGVAYSLGLGPEVAYVVRSIVRHTVGYH